MDGQEAMDSLFSAQHVQLQELNMQRRLRGGGGMHRSPQLAGPALGCKS